MKKTILTITSLALLTLTSSAQLSNGLVAHYKLDGNANDASTNSNNGTASTGVTYGTDNLSLANMAGVFNNSYIEAPNIAALNISDEITISAWIYLDKVNPVGNGSGAYGSIVIEKGLASNNIHNYKLFIYTTTADSSKVFANFAINGTDNNAHGVYSPTNQPLSKKTWHLITGTYDGTEMKLYMDGVLIDNNNIGTKTMKTNSEPLRIGKTISSGFPYPFYGKINDVRIYNRALSASDVAKLYSRTNSIYHTVNVNNVSIYPNPSNGVFTIKTVETNTATTIIDAVGKIVFQQNLESANEHSVDLSNLKAGIYFVSLKTNSSIQTKKIIVQ